MHHSCDKIIGDSSLGGFMSFDSDQLPWNHQYECSVQVRPAVFNDPHRTPRILFHFSDVEIGQDRCDDVNLTVVDGSLRPWDYNHDTVKGTFAASILSKINYIKVEGFTLKNSQYL